MEEGKGEGEGLGVVCGIDCGTTNCCISIWRNGHAEIIPDEFGNRTIPSYVSMTNVSRYVGNDAKNQKEINVENVIYEVKRIIGRNYDDPIVREFEKLLSYRLIRNERDTVSIQTTVRNQMIITPEEITSIILMKLKNMATKYLGEEVKNVVVTIPAHFSDCQREATRNAIEIAGLNCLRMIHEPTAAALAYGVMERSYDSSLTVLVYDFGGGTLDCSLMQINNGIFQVLASTGISYFGGMDFDNRLMSFSMAKFSRQFGIEVKTERLSCLCLQKLRQQCELAKKILSTHMTAYISVKNFHDNKDLLVRISRQQFENICNDLFLLSMKSVDDALNENNITVDDVDEVILVGGMTRMPRIRNMLSMKFNTGKNNQNKINISVNPEEAVSVGAAIQGYILANRDDAFSDSVTLLDVTPLSLGVEVMKGCMDILIERNTPIPFEVTKMYSTDTDYVDHVIIKIFEGERSMTRNNLLVGEFILTNIPQKPSGVPEIEITFSIDSNGIVTVTALEKENQEQNQIIVQTNKNGLKAHQLKALIEEAREQELLDELDRSKKILFYEIESFCGNIVSNLSNTYCKLNENDKLIIIRDIEEIKSWLKAKPYSGREKEEYEEISENIKKKYGTLILFGKQTDDTVKAVSEKIEATTVYGTSRDDDDMKEDIQRCDNVDMVDDLVVDRLSGNTENAELVEMRKNLNDLCESVLQIVYSTTINLTREQKNEFLYYIDDVMLWFHTHESPTIKDYKEKIEYINSLCNEMCESFEKNNANLFLLPETNNSESENLEKMLIMLLTGIKNNQLPGSPENLSQFEKKLQQTLCELYKEKEEQNDKKIFETKCSEYLEIINNECKKIYEKSIGINLDNQPIISANVIEIAEVGGGDGINLLDIVRHKQNEEMKQTIDMMILNEADPINITEEKKHEAEERKSEEEEDDLIIGLYIQ